MTRAVSVPEEEELQEMEKEEMGLVLLMQDGDQQGR